MRRIWLATTNAGKRREFIDLMGDLPVVLMPAPENFEVAETGTTFAANALRKAQALATQTGDATVADDSGLVVAALDGAPGLHSARYSGEPRPDRRDAANRSKRLAAMAAVPPGRRQAYFECAIVLCWPGRAPATAMGRLDGTIAHAEAGTAGFGYDAVFVPAGYTATLAQIDRAQRYDISHRAQALRALRQTLVGAVAGAD